MPISSAQIQMAVNVAATKSTAVTTTTAATGRRDSYVYSNGTGSLQITSAIDTNITIASNSTTTALSSLTDTLGAAFSFTKVKGIRVYSPSTNGNVTVTSNITGFPVGVLLPNTTWAAATGHANGYAIAGTNTITFAGVTSDIVTLTLLVS